MRAGFRRFFRALTTKFNAFSSGVKNEFSKRLLWLIGEVV